MQELGLLPFPDVSARPLPFPSGSLKVVCFQSSVTQGCGRRKLVLSNKALDLLSPHTP